MLRASARTKFPFWNVTHAIFSPYGERCATLREADGIGMSKKGSE
jgi:hypothetical protein